MRHKLLPQVTKAPPHTQVRKADEEEGQELWKQSELLIIATYYIHFKIIVTIHLKNELAGDKYFKTTEVHCTPTRKNVLYDGPNCQ
jgi:hypothetical protein